MNKEDAWAEKREYLDKAGRNIIEFEVMEGPERGSKLYKGKINMKVKVQTPVATPLGTQTQQQIQDIPLEFDFAEGKGLSWCKRHFDDAANEAVKEWTNAQKEAQKKRKQEKNKEISVPGKQVLGPDGRPLG